MAESLDVSARLAEGRPAVDNIGDYVWACHLLGYQNADLTLHPAQPYIAYNDLPKVENLKKIFAENYQEKPTLVRSVSN